VASRGLRIRVWAVPGCAGKQLFGFNR